MPGNPYPETVSGIPVSDNPFKGVDLSDLRPSTKLFDNYDMVSKENPDNSAKIVDLSNKLQQPEIFVANNLDEAQRTMERPDFGKLANDYPHLSSYLADPKKMAIAYDDIHNLSKIEQITQTHSFIEAIGAGLESSSAGLAIRGKMPNIQLPENATFSQKLAASAGGLAGDLPAMAVGGLAGLFGGPTAPYLSTAGAFALPAATKQMLIEHYQNGDIATTAELMRRVFSVGKEALKGGAIGAATAGGAALGVKVLEGPIAASIERSLPYGAQTVITKGAQTVAKTTGELAGMTVGGAAVEGKMPTAEDVALNAVLVGGLHVSGMGYGKIKDMRKATIQAESAKAYIENLAESAKASKLDTRAPEELKSVINQQSTSTFVAIDKFATFFQSKGIDPEQAAKELGVDNSYNEARFSGGYIEIPMGTMVSKQMEPFRAELAPHVKMDIERPSLFEIQEENANNQKLAEQYISESDKAIKANPELQTAHDFMVKDFKESAEPAMSGVKGRGAKSSVQHAAEVNAAFTITEAAKRGIDPMQFYQDNKPNMFGPDSPMPNGGRKTVIKDFATELNKTNPNILFQSPSESFGKGEPLAAYTKTQQGAVINMFKGANASSLLHELSHHWLDSIHEYVKSGKADESYLADWKITQGYLGHETGKELTREQHEKFAQSFEKYLMEGKAPSVELQTTFEKLKSWMMKVYDGVKNKLGIEINPEIRGVFDRMLASKEAIEQARADMGYESGKVEGLQGDELKARQMAESMLLKPLMDEMGQANKERLAQERIKAEAEAKEAIKADPVYQSIQDIISDNHKIGTKVTEQMIRNESDKYILGELSEEKSAQYDIAAELNGFSSGDELLKKIASSEHSDITIKNMVDAKMKPFERLNDPAALKEDALKALHTGDNMGRLIALEGQVLEGMRLNTDVNAELSAQRRANASREWEAVKAMAAENLGNKNIKEAGKFRTYYTLERKAAERVAKAMAKGDTDAAIQAKREQLVSHALAAEAIRLKDRIERNIKYLEKQQGADKTIFKDVKHFVQVASLLERFGLARKDFKQDDRRETLAQWSSEYSGMPGEAISPIKDWILNEAKNKPFNSLTANELKDLRDTIAHIKLKANEELSISLGEKRALIAALAGEMSTTQVESGNIGHTVNTSGSMDWVDKIISTKDWARNELINVETLLNKLDSYKNKGIWWRAFFEGSMRAMDAKAEDGFKATEEQARIWSAYNKKELADMYSKKLFVPEFGVSLTKSEIMTIALNWGTAMNKQRLIEGSGKYRDSNGVNWTEEKVKSVLDREMSKRDWDTNQANLNHVNSFWPRIAAKYLSLYGFEPEKISADPITTKYGIYDGGYFPLRKDPRISIKGMEELKAEQALGDVPMHIAYTKNGFTKERTIGAQYAVSLDIRGLSKHMTDVIHDLNMREWVIDSSRLLANKEVQTSLQDGLGQEGYTLVKDWVKSIAGTRGYESWDSPLRELRRRTVIANLGFRIKSAMLQFDDVFTYGSVDPKNYGVMNVMTEVASHYTKLLTMQEPLSAIVDRVYSKSKYMKFERGEYIDRDLDARAMRIFGQDSRMGEVSMSLMRAMDHMIAMPAWEGAYKKGLEIFKGNESEAVDYADTTIRTAQSSSRISEMAKFMTGSEFKKALTIFYSFTSKKISILYAATDKVKSPKDVSQMVGTYAALLLWPSLLASAIHDGWPSDDKKKKKWLKQLLTGPAQLFPVIRDVGDLIADKALGLPSFGYQATPLTGGIEAIGNAVGKAVSPKVSGMQKIEAAAKVAAYAVPYPVQANDWLFNVADYVNGNMEPKLEDLTKRRPVKER